MHLIVGCSNAGKSTLLDELQDAAEGSGEPLDVVLGWQLKGRPVPTGPRDVVHFNLLRGWDADTVDTAPVTLDLDPLLPSLIEAADEVTVVLAPPAVLVERGAVREVGETRHAEPVPYDAERWRPVIESDRLPQIYEHLALALDASGTTHRYLCTNAEAHPDGEALEVSRWDVPAMGGPDAASLCAAGHPDRVIESQASYQGDYRAGSEGSARSLTMARALQMPLAGRRVLDIGCAEGAATFSAARMGAQVTGLEPWPSRFEEAQRLAASLGAEVDLRNVFLGEIDEPDGAFDVVMALNVIHHQVDPFAFLDAATRLSSSHLVVEFPSLNDVRFRDTLDLPDDTPLPDDLPLMGVSTAEKDQTFVFAPASLVRYLTDTVRAFGHHEVLPSPKAGRFIVVFSDRLGSSKTFRTSEKKREREGAAAMTTTAGGAAPAPAPAPAAAVDAAPKKRWFGR